MYLLGSTVSVGVWIRFLRVSLFGYSGLSLTGGLVGQAERARTTRESSDQQRCQIFVGNLSFIEKLYRSVATGECYLSFFSSTHGSASSRCYQTIAEILIHDDQCPLLALLPTPTADALFVNQNSASSIAGGCRPVSIVTVSG